MTSAWFGGNVSFTMPIKATHKGERNASEYYTENITTQISWANQAMTASMERKVMVKTIMKPSSEKNKRRIKRA